MRALLLLATIAGCANADCPDCITASLTANGSDAIAAAAGDTLTYDWASANADSASSTVTMSPGPDACGNHDGPWVVSTLEGSVSAQLLACQVGTIYTLTFAVASDAGSASSSIQITVN
jgi:hypothetical protein